MPTYNYRLTGRDIKTLPALHRRGDSRLSKRASVVEWNAPWRCSLHLTDHHLPITESLIAELCPGPKHPEYQRGHADGFEAGSQAATRRPVPVFVPQQSGILDIPTAQELHETIMNHGGIEGIASLLAYAAMEFTRSEKGSDLFVKVSEQFGIAEVPAQSLLMIGMVSASLYFNDKYGPQVSAAVAEGGAPVKSVRPPSHRPRKSAK